MIILPLLVLMWSGMHAGWECAPGSGLVTLYSHCTGAPGFVPGADRVRGVGVLSPSLLFAPDHLRAQRLDDERRVDALLRGDL